ncbi:MAG: 3-hydroxyacyl-ACP dehydratase FabZ [Deltaproteobacteria bacterium]|nr:3-hydroxyacyl-ACP dehydratase FabZ [Deltaproteobacteria bacterium]
MTPAPTELLPHRPPFLFVDRVLALDADSVRTARTFRPEEDFFRGHFPGNPIVPGVLLVEAMAQAMALLATHRHPGQQVYLTGIDRARFRQPVLPGQEVELSVRVEGVRLGVFRAKAEAQVAGVRVADAVLSGLVADVGS